MTAFALTWWTRFPVQIRRVNTLFSEAWLDGFYLTAWPRAAMAAPVLVFLFGLLSGAIHWSLYATANGNVSSNIHPIDFAQMLPLLFIAVICGALSSQLGLLLVAGFALGDLFIAGPVFAPGRGFVWNLSYLYAPKIISYLAFFLLAVTPAIATKFMAASVPRLRRFALFSTALAAVIACAMQGVSIYAWTLAAPMIVRVHWRWSGIGDPPLAVSDYTRILDPWLPLTAMIATAVRLWLSVKARPTLNIAAIAAARKEMRAIDQAQAASPTYPNLQALGSAVLVTATMAGLFNSGLRAFGVFVTLLALFLARGAILPRVEGWRQWARQLNKLPLILRSSAAIVITFAVARAIVLSPSLSPRIVNTPGEFGVQIVSLLLGLVICFVLLPLQPPAKPSSDLSKPIGTAARIIAFLCILQFVTRPAWAQICLDPFCCFNGNDLLGALFVAGLLLEFLPLILALAELAELGVLAEMLLGPLVDAMMAIAPETADSALLEMEGEQAELVASLERPPEVPDDWTETLSRDGRGKEWVDPDNPRNRVRSMIGNPNNPNNTGPYMRIYKNGQPLDINGNPVLRDDPAGHIPIDESGRPIGQFLNPLSWFSTRFG